MRRFAVAGALFAFLAVAFGAFGAHALRDRLSAEMLAVYQTGVQYQAMHALALLVLFGIFDRLGQPKLCRAAGWLFVIGVIVFSGSLYALALSGIRGFGAITPIGGLCFLAGWLALVVAAIRERGDAARGL